MNDKKESAGLPFVSLVSGGIALLFSIAADETWAVDELTGILTLGLGGVVIGTLCLMNQQTGRGKAVGGIATGAISLLVFARYFIAAISK